jgi:hypothetical protein
MSKSTCKLTGTDGNVFAIIGKVSVCLKKVKLADQAKEFTEKSFAAESYDEVLRLAMDYVDVI